MSGETWNGKCGHCEVRRNVHLPDDEGLKLLCPDGSGRTFAWRVSPGRASASFSTIEIRTLDAVIAKAMGAHGPSVSPSSPVLLGLRRKTMVMKKKVSRNPKKENP